VTREIELRPRARKDLLRFEKFLKKLSAIAAERRINWLLDQLQSLGDNPHRGQSQDRRRYVLVLRYVRSAYVIRYRLASDKVVIISIWHGKENRPR
jgi:plasmid stabilization system protein ParE